MTDGGCLLCFDTAFHHTQPEVAAAFALPRHLTEEGIGDTGFTGFPMNTLPASFRTSLVRQSPMVA